MKSETPERPMAREYEFLEDGATCRLSTEGPKKFTVSMPVEFDDNLREGALAAELLRVVAERDAKEAEIQDLIECAGRWQADAERAEIRERARIRRELLEAIDKHSFTVSGGIEQRLAVIGFGRVSPLIERVELLAALDRIAPEEVSGGR